MLACDLNANEPSLNFMNVNPTVNIIRKVKVAMYVYCQKRIFRDVKGLMILHMVCTHRHNPFERARLSAGLAPFETLKTIIIPKMKDEETRELRIVISRTCSVFGERRERSPSMLGWTTKDMRSATHS